MVARSGTLVAEVNAINHYDLLQEQGGENYSNHFILTCDCMLNLQQHTTGKTNTEEGGREELFRCLYTGLYEKVLGCALYYCGVEETAEDLAQDVFMRVWRQMDRLIEKLGAWNNWESYLYTMARNETLNYRKKQAREVKKQRSYYNNVNTVTHTDHLLEKECEQLFNRALTKLTQRQSEVYLLNQYGVERDVIAEKLGITYSTVSNTLNDARMRIKGYVWERLHINEKEKKREWLPAA